MELQGPKRPPPIASKSRFANSSGVLPSAREESLEDAYVRRPQAPPSLPAEAENLFAALLILRNQTINCQEDNYTALSSRGIHSKEKGKK